MRRMLALLTLMLSLGAASAEQSPRPLFLVQTPSSAQGELTGRLFLLISRNHDPEPRLQSGWFNSPQTFALDVERLRPGESVSIDASTLGFPLQSLADLEAGEYSVQAVFNRYIEYPRADGHRIWAPVQWEGGAFNKNHAPGNFYSTARTIEIGPGGVEPIVVSLDRVIPQSPAPADTQWLRYVRMRSERLSAFWGRPIYLGAVVLVPEGYDRERGRRYPVLYEQPGHFYPYPSQELGAPFGFRAQATPESAEDRSARLRNGWETGHEFMQSWVSGELPRMLVVRVLHPTPFADMSGVANSAANGPYEDAIVEELIPYVERHFRAIADRRARLLAGRDSGGRDALSLLLHRPDSFGGAWVFGPWAFNYRSYFGLDIYSNDNAFVARAQDVPVWARDGWQAPERQMVMTPGGLPLASFRELSLHDAVMATHAGGEYGLDDARNGPLGSEGYPRPLWRRLTGEIDREVADYWREHSDLAVYAQRHWRELAPLIAGRLNFYSGDSDYFYRGEGVRLFEAMMAEVAAPGDISFSYGPTADWQPFTNRELIRHMAAQVERDLERRSDEHGEAISRQR